MKWKTTSIILVLVLLLIGAVLLWRSQSVGLFIETPTDSIHFTRIVPATTQAAPKIKVAVYLSEYCASGADGTQWAYGHSCQIVSDLRDRELQLTPIIEPGTEAEPDLKKILHIYFNDAKPADATNAAVLKTFDVIVIPRINYVRDDELNAIEQAVKSGTGLLIRNTFGNGIPGYSPLAAELNGFQTCDFNYSPHAIDGVVLATHPILGSLHKGDTIHLTPNGAYGVSITGAVPLIEVKDPAKLYFPLDASTWKFCPLLVFELGKGRVVQCAFPAWEATPVDLQKATGGKFNVHAIEWLARRSG
jgi:hypothetical protein